MEGKSENALETAKPGTDGADLPADRLADHLARVLPGWRGPATLAKFSGGQSNPTYRIDTPAARYVLRRKPAGALLPSAHAIEREYRVMDALGRAGLAVPRVLHLCEDPGVIGTPFYLMEHLEGRVIYDTRLPGFAPEERRAVCEALVDTLAAIHGLDWRRAGLEGFGREGGYLLRQTRRWAEQYRASETGRIAEMDRLIAWLPDALAAVPDETCLVHGDYRLDNVMLAPDAPRVIAVLDWELSTLGHPLGDLAYFLMTWSFPAELRWGLADSDLAALGIPSAASLAGRYARATGRGGLPDLDLLIAYNAFRLAAILQGVYKRGLDGNAADEAALSMGADVAPLARIATEHAARAGL